MSGSLNRAMLIGHLGRDPEVKRLSSGDPVVNLRVATSENWRDKRTGDRVERTEWHNVVIYNENLCKIAEQYLRKGSKVFLEGKIQTRKWQDQGGADRYSTEIILTAFDGRIVMLSSKGETGQADAGGGSSEPQSQQRPAPVERGGSLAEELDDEIPFGPEWRG